MRPVQTGVTNLWQQTSKVLRYPANVCKSLAVVEHTGKKVTAKRAALSALAPNLYAARNLRIHQGGKGLGHWLSSVFQSRRYSTSHWAKATAPESDLHHWAWLFPDEVSMMLPFKAQKSQKAGTASLFTPEQ